jgi:hypothetical protein
MKRRCEQIYTRQRWRFDHEGELHTESLFDADGEWRCPRAAADGADRCCFHQNTGRRPSDAELAHRLVTELRGERELAAGHEPGELVGVDLDALVFTTEVIEALDDVDHLGDESGMAARQLTVVGATIDRLVLGDALPRFDVVVDGFEAESLRVAGATLDKLALSSTHVTDAVEIDGQTTSVDSIRLGTGLQTRGPVSIGNGARVHNQLLVNGDRIEVPSLVIDSGARVGLDGDGRDVSGGVRFNTVHESDTDLIVRGQETALAGLRLVDTHLGSVYLQRCLGVRDTVELRDTTLRGNLQIEETTASPNLTLTGASTAVDVVVVRDSPLEAVTIDTGASATAIKMTGDGTTVTSGVELTDNGTAVDSVRLAGGTTVHTGLWIHQGVSIRDSLQIEDATVAAPGGSTETPALRIADSGTRVGAIAMTASDVEGLSLARATIEGELRLTDGQLTHTEATPNTTGDGDVFEEAQPVVLQIEDATVGGITMNNCETTGAIRAEHAKLRQLSVRGSAVIRGSVELLDQTTIDTSLVIANGPEFSAPIVVTGGTTIGGDLQVIGDTRAVTFDCATGIVLDGCRIADDVTIETIVRADGDVIRIDNTTIEGSIGVAEATVDGDIMVCGGSVIGRDLSLSNDTTAGVVSLVDAAAVRGSFALGGATVKEVVLEDARVHRRLRLHEGATVEGPVSLERDATIGGDLVVGDMSPTDSPPTTVCGGLRLGDRRDAHPMSGGVTIDGSVAITGTANLNDGITLSDVVVGEDLHIVGKGATATVGAVDLFDCIVRGKIKLEGATIDALSLRECRVGESVWVGSVESGRKQAVAEVTESEEEVRAVDGETASELETEVRDGVRISATPVAENVIIRAAETGEIALEDTTVTGRVDLNAVVVDGPVSLDASSIGERVRVGTGRVGTLRISDSTIDQALDIGSGWRSRDTTSAVAEEAVSGWVADLSSDLTVRDLTVTEATIGGGLTLDCRIATARTSSVPAVVTTDVMGAVRLRPRLDSAGRINLQETTLPAGTIVITTSESATECCWYDLRQATLGDVSVEFENGPRTAVDYLLLLGARYDGFRFSGLPGGIRDGRLHGLGTRRVTDSVSDISSVDERLGSNRTRRYRLGDAYSRFPFTGTGYRSDDPPPALLEQTYLNAKNGASQVGDEDLAGEFFTLEKRYRRRSLWETVAGVDGGTPAGRPGRAVVDWLGNAIFDRIAVYGESPGRVVTVSAAVIAVFSVFFGVLLDRPPYGAQYLGSGILPDWLALGLQPLTLSIESFVTLVLVGPATQRLTPLVHLLGQIEGFLGVFLVALFVFTLTRSVHR